MESQERKAEGTQGIRGRKGENGDREERQAGVILAIEAAALPDEYTQKM